MAEAELIQDFPECAKKGWRYLEASQIKFDERERYKYFRHISKVWPGFPLLSSCSLVLLFPGGPPLVYLSRLRMHSTTEIFT